MLLPPDVDVVSVADGVAPPPDQLPSSVGVVPSPDAVASAPAQLPSAVDDATCISDSEVVAGVRPCAAIDRQGDMFSPFPSPDEECLLDALSSSVPSPDRDSPTSNAVATSVSSPYRAAPVVHSPSHADDQLPAAVVTSVPRSDRDAVAAPSPSLDEAQLPCAVATSVPSPSYDSYYNPDEPETFVIDMAHRILASFRPDDLEILQLDHAARKSNVTYGSACTGSENVMGWLDAIGHLILDEPLMDHTCSCDIDADIRKFLKRRFPALDICFSDIKGPPYMPCGCDDICSMRHPVIYLAS